jgi:hypothetical protein
MRRLLPVIVLVPAVLGVLFGAVFSGALGRLEGPGRIIGAAWPPAAVERRAAAERAAAARLGAGDAKQILFGDLHVHTTYSLDAFRSSLPLFHGDGTHPPADACDFARYCSALDFWSINDHAETLTPQQWRDTKETIRQCNLVAGDGANPDVVAFLGWEWTQTGPTPATHYGHRNVIFRDTDEGTVPLRPIAALGGAWTTLHDTGADGMLILMPLVDLPNAQRYLDLARVLKAVRATPVCAEGVGVRDLPDDCAEAVATPRELFARLDEWGFETLVIPHGIAWGLHAPPGTVWDNQLVGGNHDARRENLLEIYSGHGNSEEYRDWREVSLDAEGKPTCPEPSINYTPECWRAGDIIRERCLAAGAGEAECGKRAAQARELYLAQAKNGYLVVPGQRAEDWLDAGQCTDCFLPVYDLRPGGSAQYALSITNFDASGARLRYQFGFIASSDNHSARPGTGYKEFARMNMTDAYGTVDEFIARRMAGGSEIVELRAVPPTKQSVGGDDTERSTSFLYTGGLVAVHSDGRNRASIWSALKRSEVYGTSGPRILLWFDLLNAGDGEEQLPMGAKTRMARTPRFRVRAAGALRQLPGCPEQAMSALGKDRLDRLCKRGCYNPSDERDPIDRIEVIRIRPQMKPGEPIGDRIEDPWRILACSGDPAGCEVEFVDPDFVGGRRDAVYYVRAVQPATPAVNGDNLRCVYDENGRCESVKPCYSDYRGNAEDNCFGAVEERAWSSPIYVDYGDAAG